MHAFPDTRPGLPSLPEGYRVAHLEGEPVAGIMPMPPDAPPAMPPHWGSYVTVDNVDETAIVEKLHFSAAGDGELFQRPGGERRQFVICGCETHVCVLQTVLDLRERGNEVFVVEGAVSSRRASDKALALERMRQAGAVIVSREMVAFEWMERAGTEMFKSISREFIR